MPIFDYGTGYGKLWEPQHLTGGGRSRGEEQIFFVEGNCPTLQVISHKQLPIL